MTAYDRLFNRDVTGGNALRFTDEPGVATALEHDERDPDGRGAALRSRAETAYRWEDVIDGYAILCGKLVRG